MKKATSTWCSLIQHASHRQLDASWSHARLLDAHDRGASQFLGLISAGGRNRACRGGAAQRVQVPTGPKTSNLVFVLLGKAGALVLALGVRLRYRPALEIARSIVDMTSDKSGKKS